MLLPDEAPGAGREVADELGVADGGSWDGRPVDFGVAVLIVAEASLSFLGVGIQRPTPTWGIMISAGQNDLQKTPHLVFVPGAVMFVTVFALNKIGDRARSKLDPRASAI